MGWFRKKGRPDAKDVAIRAVVLRHVFSYAMSLPQPATIKTASASWSDEERSHFELESRSHRDEHWASLGDLKKYLSPSEKRFSEMTRSNVEEQALLNGSWRVEAITVLAWALGQIADIPPFDEQSTPELLGGFMWIQPELLISAATLRSNEEIEKERDRAQSWHWRSRTRRLIADGAKFPEDPNLASAGLHSFDDVVRQTSVLYVEDGTIDAHIDFDFPAFGKAYRDLSEEEWSTVRSITMERHTAFNWLCGYAPGHRWDETPTDT